MIVSFLGAGILGVCLTDVDGMCYGQSVNKWSLQLKETITCFTKCRNQRDNNDDKMSLCYTTSHFKFV